MSYVSHDGLAYFKSKLDHTFIADIVFDDGDIRIYGGDGTLLKTVVQEGTVTQKKSTTNKEYPILLCWDADAEEDQTMKTVWYGLDARINPKFGYLYARRYYTEHPSYERTDAPTARAEWHHIFTDAVSAPMGEVYEYLDRVADGGEHRMELRLYGNPLSQYVDTPNHNEATDAVSIGVGATKGEKLTFFGYCPSTPIYLENGSTMRKSTVRGDQYGKDIITRDWLNLNGSITGLVHTYMDETIDGAKTFKKTVTINSGDNNNKAGLYVQGNSEVHGNEHVYGTGTVDGKLTANNGLEVIGNAKATTLTVTSGATISGGATVATGDLTVTSGGIVANNGTGTFKTLNVTSGATIGSGGITVSGPANLNGGTTTTTLTASSNATVGGNLSVSGTTTATGQITANGGVQTTNLNATGNTTLKNLSVTSNTTIGGGLTVNGGTTLKNTTVENLHVTSNIYDSGNNEYVQKVINNSSSRTTIINNLIAPNGGLEQDTNKRIRVKAGNGVTVDSNGVSINFAALKENNETEFNKLMESFVDAQRISSTSGKNQFYVDGDHGFDTNAIHSLGTKADLTALYAVSTSNLNDGDYYTVTSKNRIYVWYNNEWSIPTAATRGTPAAPFKTIQACVNYITKIYNFHSVNSYINCRNITASNNPGRLVLPNYNRTTANITIRAAEWTSSTARNNPTIGITSNSIKINYAPDGNDSRYAVGISGTGTWKLRNFDVTITDTGITTSGGHLAALSVADSATGDLAYCKFTVNRDSRYPENADKATGEHVIYAHDYGHVDIGPCVIIVGGDFTSPINNYGRELNGLYVVGNGSLQIDDTRDQSNQANGVDKRLVFTGNFYTLIACTSQMSRNKAYMGKANTNGVNKADYRFYIYSGGQVAMSDSGKIDADHNDPKVGETGELKATDTWLDKTTSTEPFHEHIAGSRSYVQTATYSWYD